MSKRQKLIPPPTSIYNLPNDLVNREILSSLTQRDVDAFSKAVSVSKTLSAEKDILKILLQEKLNRLSKEMNSFDDAVNNVIKMDQYVKDKLLGVYPTNLKIPQVHHLPFLWKSIQLKKDIHDLDSAIEQIHSFIKLYLNEFDPQPMEYDLELVEHGDLDDQFWSYEWFWGYKDNEDDIEDFYDDALQQNKTITLLTPHFSYEDTIQEHTLSKPDQRLLSLIYKLGFYQKLDFMSGLVLRVPHF